METFQEIKKKSIEFDLMLQDIKQQHPINWYPYNSMANFIHLDMLLDGDDLFNRLSGNHIADIGCADGDLGLFLETLGFEVDMIDYGPTNFNELQGARIMHQELNSKNSIHSIDLDSQFRMPRERYDLIVFLGILYHLKNPYYILEQLGKVSQYMLLSTRVARMTTDKKTVFKDVPVAYLVDPFESNNDSTNYWMFSESGLKRILNRTGWDIVKMVTVGDTETSDPASPDRDERAFCLLRSRVFK